MQYAPDIQWCMCSFYCQIFDNTPTWYEYWLLSNPFTRFNVCVTVCPCVHSYVYSWYCRTLRWCTKYCYGDCAICLLNTEYMYTMLRTYSTAPSIWRSLSWIAHSLKPRTYKYSTQYVCIYLRGLYFCCCRQSSMSVWAGTTIFYLGSHWWQAVFDYFCFVNLYGWQWYVV